MTPIAGDRQLTVSRPAGRAVIADVIRAGGARAWCRGDPVRRRLPVYSPPASGRAAAALLGREEARGLTGPWMSLLHAGPPAASPRPYCARACGRAEPGPVGRSSTTPLCPGPPPGRTRPSRPLHLASTVPGPAAGSNSAQSASPPRRHCVRARGRAGPGSGRTLHRPAGGPRPAPATVVAVTPAVRRLQTGRCGVLTRIPVGAAAVAGPGRLHSPAELAGPDPTTRHGDEAAASCSCRFPVPFGVSRALTVTSCNVLRCCTHLEGHLAMPQLSIVALPSPSLFQPCCCIPCNTPAPPVVPFALILAGGRFLLPQGSIRPARRAGPLSESARGPHPALWAGTALHRAP